MSPFMRWLVVGIVFLVIVNLALNLGSVETRSASATNRTSESEPEPPARNYTISFDCTIMGRRVDMYVCMQHNGTIEVERNGVQEIIRPPETRLYHSKTIDVPERFSLRVQNMNEYNLSVTVKDESGRVVFERDSGPYGVIAIRN